MRAGCGAERPRGARACAGSRQPRGRARSRGQRAAGLPRHAGGARPPAPRCGARGGRDLHPGVPGARHRACRRRGSPFHGPGCGAGAAAGGLRRLPPAGDAPSAHAGGRRAGRGRSDRGADRGLDAPARDRAAGLPPTRSARRAGRGRSHGTRGATRRRSRFPVSPRAGASTPAPSMRWIPTIPARCCWNCWSRRSRARSYPARSHWSASASYCGSPASNTGAARFRSMPGRSASTAPASGSRARWTATGSAACCCPARCASPRGSWTRSPVRTRP